MITTTWMTAPAGVLGRGSLAVRPSLLAAVAGVQGTGLPTAARVAIAPIGGSALGAAQRPRTTQHDGFAQNDGTTLGFHRSGRPLS